MPSDLEKIGLQAVLDTALWTQNVRQYITDTEEMGAATDKAAKEAAKATEEQARRQEQALQKAGLAFAAVGAAAVALLGSIAMTASRTEELGVILDVTAENARRMAEAEGDWSKAAALTSEAVDQQVQAVKDLGITTQAASQLVALMIRYNLDWTKSTELAALAQDAATFAAQGSSEALQGLIHGITTLNPRVLRNYGILINLDQEYSKFAETTGRTTASITDMEKQTIAFNAVLAQGPNIAGAYEAAMDTASKQIRSLTRDTTEVAEAFGEHLTPALTGGVGALRSLLKWLRDLPDPVQATAVQIGIAAGGLSSFVGAAAVAIPKIISLAKAFKDLALVSKLASAGLLGPAGLAVGLAAVAAAAAIYAREVEKANRAAAASILETSDTYAQYTIQAEEAGQGSYILSEGLYEVAKAAQEAGAGINAIDLTTARRELESVFLLPETGIKGLDQVLRFFETTGVSVEALTDQMRDLIPNATDAQLAVLADAESVRELGERAGVTGDELDGMVTDVNNAADAAIALRDAGEGVGRSMVGIGEAIGTVETEARSATVALAGVNVVMENLEGSTEESAKALREYYDVLAEYGDLSGAAVEAAADRMIAAEDKAAESREKASADLSDAQTELEEEHADTVGDLLQEIADVDKNLKADRLKAEEDYQKARAEAADDAHAAILAAERELDQNIQDAWKDLQRKLADIKHEGNEELEDLDRDLGRDLNELTAETAAEQEVIWAEYYATLEDLATAHGEKMASITETYAAKREAIEQKYSREPEPETTDELREALQEELRLMEEQQAKTGLLDKQREYEILQALDELKAQELAALEEAQAAELAAEEQAYAEQQALAEQRRDEALAAEQSEYEARRAQRLQQYDEALQDLEISQQRERDAAKRAYGEKVGDLKASLAEEKAAIEQRYQERLASLDTQLAEEQSRLDQAAAAERGRLQAQLADERANYAEREQALRDHYDDQVKEIADSLAEEQKAIQDGLADELRETITGLGKKSDAFREAYANELRDLDAYLAERLARERQYQQELEAMFGVGSPSRWMQDFGKDLREGFEIGLGPNFAADLASGLGTIQAEVGNVQPAPAQATDLISALGAFQGGLGALSPTVIQPAALPMPQMPSTTSMDQSTSINLTANYAREQSEASIRDDLNMIQLMIAARGRF